MSNLCKIPSCYAYGRYCRIPGHMGSKDTEAVAPEKPAKTSEKMEDALKIYKKLRKPFLTKYFRCQVKKCKNASVHIHHKKGREGKLLNDTKYWMAVCNGCHERITEDSKWAIEQGYSISRLNVEQ